MTHRRAVVSTEIVDIMKAAGLETPDISILSDQFLAEVRETPVLTYSIDETVLANVTCTCPPSKSFSAGAMHLLLFSLPNENADHSTPERIRIAELGSFNEPLLAIQTVVMQLVGTRPPVLPN